MTDPNSAGSIRFGGALRVAEIFKLLAVVTVALGALTLVAVLADDNDTVGAAAGITTVVGTIVSASVLAFLGYVLEVLVELYDQAWNIRVTLEDDDEE